MTIISRHSTFGDALDAMFGCDADYSVRHVKGAGYNGDDRWCVVDDADARADYDRECRCAAQDDRTCGTDFTW